MEKDPIVIFFSFVENIKRKYCTCNFFGLVALLRT